MPTFFATFAPVNKKILRLAIPNVISNITVPLLGLISTRIAHDVGGEVAIAAVGVAASYLGFIYWNCAFIRMGASGFTAQAYGARDFGECANVLVRSLLIAVILAALLLAFQGPLGRLGMMVMGKADINPMVASYFYSRIWAAPATVSHFAIAGWFIGMQNSRTPMIIAISINVLGAIFSYLLVNIGGMGVEGIGWGIMAAQYMGLILAGVLWWRYYKRFLHYINWRTALSWKPLSRFFNVNKDIFIRTLCNTTVYTFFPYISRTFGTTTLSTNTILIQIFTLYSYIQDGLGYAAEALTGRFVGARNPRALRESIIKMFWWSGAVAAIFVGVYLGFWRDILLFFGATPEMMADAQRYILWVTFVPLLSFAPFLMDGILVGATRTDILRNTLLVATALFFALYYGLAGMLGGPTSLWLAFFCFIGVRGIAQIIFSNRLEGLLWHKTPRSALQTPHS